MMLNDVNEEISISAILEPPILNININSVPVPYKIKIISLLNDYKYVINSTYLPINFRLSKTNIYN